MVWSGRSICSFGRICAVAPDESSGRVGGKSSKDFKELPHVSPGAKIFTALAGPVASLGLGVLCAVGVWIFGVPTNMTYRTTTIGWVEPGTPAAKAGILPGDVILAIDHQRPERWAGRPGAVVESILLGTDREILIELDRNGKEIVTARILPEQTVEMEGLRRLGFEMYPAQSAWVDQVIAGASREGGNSTGGSHDFIRRRKDLESSCGQSGCGRWP